VPNHVFGYGGLGDLNTQFEQFTMDPRSTSNGICWAHGPDQLANLSPYGLAGQACHGESSTARQDEGLYGATR
jgi:hypothetical protein